MNEISKRPPFLRPKWLLLGFAVTVLLLAIQGHRYAYRTFHENFVRFYPLAAPDTRYQPALDEYLALVRSQCERDQVLVLIGGNSILYGVGQPPDKVWSKKLQELLGPDYRVINFAFRGGTITDGAAVISEVLSKEYPRQILIANSAPVQAGDAIGTPTYNYLIKSALDRGLLENFPERTARLAEGWPGYKWSAERGYNLLDAALRYRVWGNAISWTHFSTVTNTLTPKFPDWMRARKDQLDTEPDIDTVPVADRYPPAALGVEMEITRSFSALMIQDPVKGWVLNDASKRGFAYFAAMTRPPDLRSKTLILTSSNSPYYLDKLTPSERARDAAAMKASVEEWERSGYASLAYGEGFTKEDFVDRTHLTANGGAKLATLVAAKVKDMTKDIHYE